MSQSAIVYLVLAGIASYMLGNINFSVLLTKVMGKADIRTTGSGNPGATNMLRTLGPLMAILTLLGDTLKSIAAGLIGYFTLNLTYPDLAVNATLLCCVLCVAGHNWPVLMKFKGGKGVASTLGCAIMIIGPLYSFAILFLFFVILSFSHYVSVSSLIAILLTFLTATVLYVLGRLDALSPVAMFILALMAFWSHRSNIKKLAKGEERKTYVIKKT